MNAAVDIKDAADDDAFDVFCSYHRKNKTIVHEIIEKFQEYFSIWIDNDNEEDYEDIEKALKKSRVIICFISKAYCKSNDCLDEIKLANKLKKIRLVVLLDKKLPNAINQHLQGALKFNAYSQSLSDEQHYEKLLNLVSDLVDRRKPTLDQMIIEVNFLPLNPSKIATQFKKDNSNNILLRPHVLKHILDTAEARKVDLKENTYSLLPLANGQLFSCNGRDGFSMYDEEFHLKKTFKQMGVCCFKHKIFCYHAVADSNDNVICCCEITPWNAEKYHAIVIADFNFKKIQILANYGNGEKQQYQYFQGIFLYKDFIYISTGDEIIKLNKAYMFESSHKLDYEPNEIAFLNDVLCVNTPKQIIFYDFDTFYIKYKYPSSGRYEISVINNSFYIFSDYEKLQCFNADGKLIESATICISNKHCKHSRGRLVYFKDKLLIQTSDYNSLSVFDLNNIIN